MTRKKQGLGLWMCIALVCGNMIGSGVFLLPSSLAPYGGLAIIGWVLTAIGAVLLALVFAGLMVIGVMGVVMYELFALVERRLTGWAHRNPNAPH